MTYPSKTLESSLLVKSLLVVMFIVTTPLGSPAVAQEQEEQGSSSGEQIEDDQPSTSVTPKPLGKSYDQELAYSDSVYDPVNDPRQSKPDSIRYYGPGRTWQYWQSNGMLDQETWQKGRDTWWFFTAGNERFYRALAVKLGKLDVSVDFFRLLDSRNRDQRFQQLGLINEPNFEQASEPDEFGLWMDTPIKTNPEFSKVEKNGYYSDKSNWQSDGVHPADPYYPQDNVRDYGLPTGVVGLRKFPNPKFSGELKKQWLRELAEWDGWNKLDESEKGAAVEPPNPVEKYFANPGKVEPPYLVGITCAFCHVAFDPTNPPADPAKPRWENLSANIGNQYFREGDLFFGWGRITGGDANRTSETDPYQTLGLGGCGTGQVIKAFPNSEIRIMQDRTGTTYATNGNASANISADKIGSIDSMTLKEAVGILQDAPAGRGKQHLTNLLFHYAQSQQSGTSETSRFSYDFINNPNTINKIFFVAGRPRFVETSPTGERIETLHVLKDGADSVGIPAALARVFVNIGAESEYWLTRLWNPLTGTGPYPLSIDEMNLGESLSDFRRRELKESIPNIGNDWKRVQERMPALANYLTSYNSPFLLKDAVAREIGKLDPNADKEKIKELANLLPDETRLANGRRMFGLYCAKCHSNRKPTYPLTQKDHADFFRQSVEADDFLIGNPLTNDARIPVTQLGTNSQRAFATNAIDGEIWAEFSSKDYKALPSVGTMQFESPLHLLSPTFGKEPIKTTFVAPGGGRGYYRTASLVSLWATAPYLHNNSVGRDPYRRFTYQTDNPFDPKTVGFSNDVVTVQGRMDLFQDGIEKLLGLKPRDHERSIKLSYAQASLLTGLDRTKSRLIAEALSESLIPKVEGIIQKKLEAKIEDDKVRKIAQAAIDESINRARESFPDFLNSLDKQKLKTRVKLLKEDVQQIVKPFLVELLEKKLESTLVKALEKAFPDLPAGLSSELVEVLKKVDLGEIIENGNGIVGAGPVSLFFPEIPRGTPINLILNQNIKKAPYAVQALLSHKDDPRKLAEALLQLSDCPDIVEDRGHHFPTPEQRKLEGEGSMRDLIEYLKTL